MGDEGLLGVRKWFNRFAVALGGFLIFVGIIIMGSFLIFYFMENLNHLETGSIQNLSLLLLLSIGLVDLIAGVILWRR
jgi:hypothetical protein